MLSSFFIKNTSEYDRITGTLSREIKYTDLIINFYRNTYMDIKQRFLNAVKHLPADRVPLMYRGFPETTEILLKHFFNKETKRKTDLPSIIYNNRDVKENYGELLKKLCADMFAGGYALSAFTTYFPCYTGPDKGIEQDHIYWFTWGIDNRIVKLSGYNSVMYGFEPPLAGCNSIHELLKYDFPRIEWFDLSKYYSLATGPGSNTLTPDELATLRDRPNEFACTGLNNSIFTMCSYLRNLQQFLEDLVLNIKFAKTLIDAVGEFCYEFNRALLSKIGDKIEVYAIWDDVAMQSGIMISPPLWRKLLKPWFKKIIAEAKKYELIVFYHCCGSYHEIVPDMIDLGVDILDPVQTSAIDWDLSILKMRYGKHLCFHGGYDMQLLLTGCPDDIKKEGEKIKRLFDNKGGIILGPSAEITPDVPVENIKAMYRCFQEGE
jgi:uroporphyrinogen decarboxylase